MSFSWHLKQINYCNVIWQNAIKLVRHLFYIYWDGQIKVAKLLGRMHPGVCSSTSHSFHLTPEEGFQCMIYFLLNSMSILLNLPTVVCLPVVRNFDEISQ